MTTETNQAASLGQILTTAEVRDFFDLNSDNARWREIDLGDHSAAAVIVWRMQVDHGRSPVEEAQAERLVACWNACHGLSDEFLKQSTAPGLIGRTMVDETRRIAAERDAALARAATLAWEPLTPERMAAVRKDTTRTEYWLAVGGSNEPWQACWEPVLGAFYADGDGITLRPAQVTHIMRFTTPELPS